MVIPDRAPCDARGKARFQRRAARRVVAAKADRHDADALRIDIVALLEVIDAGRAGGLVVMAQGETAKPDRLPGARTVHDQTGDAATHEIGHAADELKLLADVEPIEEHDTRGALRALVPWVNEIRRQALALERHLHDLDPEVRERHMAMEARYAGVVGVEPSRVLRRAKALRHLEILASTQVSV